MARRKRAGSAGRREVAPWQRKESTWALRILPAASESTTCRSGATVPPSIVVCTATPPRLHPAQCWCGVPTCRRTGRLRRSWPRRRGTCRAPTCSSSGSIAGFHQRFGSRARLLLRGRRSCLPIRGRVFRKPADSSPSVARFGRSDRSRLVPRDDLTEMSKT